MVETIIKNPNWWKRRTALERGLTVISAAAVLAIIALAISLVVVSVGQKTHTEPKPEDDAVERISALPLHSESSTVTSTELLTGTASLPPSSTTTEKSRANEVCLTEDCIHSASTVLARMNQKVEPCDDFYNFACGKFLKSTVIPDDKVDVTTFSLIGDRLQEQLRLLVSDDVEEGESKPFTIAKNIFKACMNKTLIEERGQEPLVKIHKDLGGWPVVDGDSWDDNKFDWIETTKNFRRYGFSVSYLIDFIITTNIKNTTSRIIYLDQASIGLFREFLILGKAENAVKAYYNYAVDIAVLFGADRKRAEKEMDESLDFEIELAKISLPREKRRNETELYNAMTLAEAQVNYTYINWVDYINALLPEGVSVDEDEVVVNRVPSFLTALGELLERTPKRTVANYLMWRITGISSFFMSTALRKRQLKFTKDVLGKEEEEPRWKECVDIASGTHGLPIQLGAAISVSALYIRKYFNEDSKKSALDMVNQIRSQFENTLDTVEWMDDETRVTAKEKLRLMDEHIGYPNELQDNENLERYYAQLEINPDLYLESVLNMSIFGNDYIYNKLRKPVNKTDWETHSKAAVVGAYYAFTENSIQFPAGILQGHFFSADRPKYLNYGAIGFVIGHEITHGFDDQGRQFDDNGNLAEWWAAPTKTAYLDKAQCIIDQYGNFTEPTTGLNLNGINTQGENIADNGGVKVSYLAYKTWAAANGPEPKLPGLDYSPTQLFWISAAQNWCAVFRPEALKLRITTGVHSPTEFRVFGPLSNYDSFAKDWNCPVGTPMNPVEKCEVW